MAHSSLTQAGEVVCGKGSAVQSRHPPQVSKTPQSMKGASPVQDGSGLQKLLPDR